MKTNVTPAMQWVLDYMKRGWTLRMLGAGDPRPDAFLQDVVYRPGGGIRLKVNIRTVRALLDRKLIVSSGDMFAPTFKLVKK